MEKTIQISGLSKSYDGKKVIENLSFSVAAGEVYGLLGANGVGKSTTIECILGTKKADSGTVRILGLDPWTERKQLFKQVGVQFQEANYPDKIKVKELCEETTCLYRYPLAYKELLHKFGLADKENAFVNELSKIFHLLDIDTNEVLAAAGTKWNFLPFRPGLVGGHCIGVDPYYLIRKAQDYGYHPGLILYGRRINDTMGEYIANRVVKCMIKKDVPVKNAEVLVLGFTFKENCPDVRNTKVGDVVRVLKDYGINVSVYDPWARAEEVRDEYGIELTGSLSEGRKYDVIVLAVAHKEFLELDIPSLVSENHVVYDVKGCLNPEWVDDRL